MANPRMMDPETELALLRSKVETLMAERVAPAVSAFAGEAESMARNAGAQLRHGVDHVSDQLRGGVDEVSERVRDRPLAAIGLALLAGAAIFAMIRR
jgi:ElaB/YqjD/DUF883 family membrane-anchored ribosome-binding protein